MDVRLLAENVENSLATWPRVIESVCVGMYRFVALLGHGGPRLPIEIQRYRDRRRAEKKTIKINRYRNPISVY